jgi:hypothetical protein
VVGSHVIFVAHHVDIQRRIIVGLFEIILWWPCFYITSYLLDDIWSP